MSMSYAAWRRAVPPQVAPPTTPRANPWTRLFGPTTPAPDRAASATATNLLFGGAPPAATIPGPQHAVPAAAPRRSRAELVARFEALVRSGIINPADITDPNGNVRPEVMAQLDAIGPYRGPDVYADEQGVFDDVTGQIINPAEIRAEEWRRDFLAKREDENVARSGMYYDPATGTYRVTTTQGNALLDRFGNARTAEDRYRQQLEQANVGVMGAQQQVANAEAAYNNVAADARRTGGGYNPTGEQVAALQSGRNAVNYAQMAYNRARGVAGQLTPPIGVGALGRGLTDEQVAQLGDAARQGYSEDEWRRLMAGANLRGAQYQPAQDYRRAAMARGVF